MQKREIQMHKNMHMPRSPHMKAESISSKPIALKNIEKQQSSKQKSNSKSKKFKKINSQQKITSKSQDKSKGKTTLSSFKSKQSKNKPKSIKNIYTGQQTESLESFVDSLTQNNFKSIQTFKLKILNWIFKNRIIRDEQYDNLYEKLIQKFQEKEELIKNILFQIVSTLDS